MGEVYHARDTQLGRGVALKILPEKYIASQIHLRRFEQEARATSSLNHPNILTIYEIGQADSTYYIATEFVEGDTLRQAIANKKLDLRKAIDVAIQVSSGLAAAHSAGIVHRDIKPENIMLRKDGYVKLLDFGLAKLVEDAFYDDLRRDDDSTIGSVHTQSGSIVGTISYMSPEQLRGRPIDARTDIWSVGVVLYEMVAGRTPFLGNSNADVIVTILERELPPLESQVPKCPRLLDQVVDGMLTKVREERYQSIAEVLTDLEQLRDELRTTSKSGEAQTLDIGPPRRRSGSGSSPQSSLDTPTERRFFSRRVLVVAALLLLPLLYLGYLGATSLYRRARTNTPTATHSGSFREARSTKLVDTGMATDAVISPDGKYVAYSIDEGGQQSLWVKQLIGGNSVPVAPPAAVRYAGMTFSPDANYIYYIAFEQDANLGALFRIPVLGRTAKKILEDIDTPVSFSPDGRQFAFIRGYPSLKQTALMIANADGSGERKLATRQSPDDFGWKGAPAWSPDGHRIAVAVGTYDFSMRLVAINISDGREQNLLPGKWPWIGQVIWLHDGTGLLMVAKDQATGFRQVWYFSNSGADLQRITSDLDDFGGRSLSVTADSANIVLVQTEYRSSIWLAPINDARRARQIGASKSDGSYGLSWTPDGKIVYASRESGNLDIWIMDRNGADRKQLTFDSGANYEPMVTRDGTAIVFTSTRKGEPDVWKMDIVATNPKQLTTGANASWPQTSPDGRWVVYKSYKSGKRTLWRVSIDGGAPMQITDKYTGWPAYSPDGKLIACEYWDEQLGTRISLAILSADGGAPVKLFPWPPVSGLSASLPRVIAWHPDGKSIAYADNQGSVGNIWSQAIDGSALKQLTKFDADRIFWFDWSRDGKELALARGTAASDVVMITRAKN